MDNHVLRVEHVRQWRGLLKRQAGAPLAHFSVRPGAAEWVEDLVLKSGDRVILGDRIAIEFYWGTSSHTPTPDRWGVRERDRTSWSAAFTPGTGFETRDGAEVTLIEQSQRGAIRVAIKRGDMVDVVQIEPGQEQAGIVNAARPFVETSVRFVSEEASAATVVMTSRDTRIEARAHAGENWTFQDMEFRLHDVQDEAVYVPADTAPWLEAVFAIDGSPNHRLRVREGVVERLGDWRLRVSRQPIPGE